jgi:hypothetical protein
LIIFEYMENEQNLPPIEGVWSGTIVKESLEDPSYVDTLKITKIAETNDADPAARWHLYEIEEVSSDQINELSHLIKPTKWYAHFWREGDVVVVYRDRIFEYTKTNAHERELAIRYGLSVGIPIEQLDFKTK